MNESLKAQRVSNTLTGHWEKILLQKMARALPGWVMPDHLTILGIISTFVIALGYILSWLNPWWLMLANAGFAIHWFGDSLDGTLARFRHIERERYGYFVDHISDAFMTAVVCVAFGLSPMMQLEIGLMLTIGYLLINIYAHVSVYTTRIFRLSYAKLGPTEIRIIVILANTLLIFWNPVLLHFKGISLTFIDLAGLFFSFGFLVVFIVSSVLDAIKLDRLDRAESRHRDSN